MLALSSIPHPFQPGAPASLALFLVPLEELWKDWTGSAEIDLTWIILIPFFLCIIALFRNSTQKAFLNIYLPVALLFPTYYFWKAPNLPAITLSEAVLIPLGVAIAFTELPRWKFSRVDLWMLGFVFTAFYADLRGGKTVISIFELFNALATALTPYIIGKLLIEQVGARVATVKRIVFLLFASCIFSTYEFRMGENPFTLLWAPFFPNELFAWKTQIRWGHGRVSGPFGQSELAGMVFFTGLIFALWLVYNKLWEPKFSFAKWLPFNKGTIIAWMIGIALLMTQARGPWLGALAALPIAFVGRSKNVRRNALVLLVLSLVALPALYVVLSRYAGGSPSSGEQQTAQYRQQLLDNYIPIAKAGGLFGWGQDIPRVYGQDSIDNEYLYVALVQGLTGFALFVLLCLETARSLARAAWHSSTPQDTYFCFSLLGIFAGVLLTIFTVFLGNQPYELFFLLAGWAQALDRRERPAVQPVFQQIYT